MKTLAALASIFVVVTSAFAAHSPTPQIVARIDVTNQTSSGSTALYTPHENGLFRISAYGETINPAINGGVTVSFTWTDDVNSHNGFQGRTAFGFDVTSDSFQNYGSATLVVRGTAGVPISAQSQLNLPLGGSATYSLFFVVERLE